MTAAAAMAGAADLREQGARCRALWTSVIARILLDCTRTDADGAAARLWLAQPDALALELAGLDPEPAADALARLAECGERHAPR